LLQDEVRFCRGVGPARAELLGRLGIRTRGDLLLHIPRTYLDRRGISRICDLVPGSESVVSASVSSVRETRTRNGRRMLVAVLTDGTGRLEAAFLNAGYLRKALFPGRSLLAAGRVELRAGLSMFHPELHFPAAEDVEMLEKGSILPVYPLTSGLSQGVLRSVVSAALEDCREGLDPVLPPEVLRREGFPERWEAYRAIHEPAGPEEPPAARRILALEELLLYQMALRRIRAGSPGLGAHPIPAGVEDRFRSSLPFVLTPSQVTCLRDVLADMARRTPMRRLLQGDVGSGKTVVAAGACLSCISAGLQCAVLAPTEVLAEQHAVTFRRLLGGLGARIGMLTGGSPPARRRELLSGLQSGGVDLLVGTHAILEPEVGFRSLALLIVDEQHKFGVEQREALLAGRDPRPHLLVMSATPIPRTLAMTFYGDLDTSRIVEMPPGRGVTETRRVSGDQGRQEAMGYLLERLDRGERAYVVYPLREASEKQDLRDAATARESLARGPAGRHGVGLLTGAMTAAAKLEAATAFASGSISTLVSTTVVEVGLDVPEATVMIVAHADRFGLSQLHQLRGRIGRGGRDARCYLVAPAGISAEARARLDVLVSSTDGFAIAEKDLALRGPGDFMGTRQHGIPEFRAADLSKDLDLVAEAGRLALTQDGAVARNFETEIRWRFGDRMIPIA